MCCDNGSICHRVVDNALEAFPRMVGSAVIMQMPKIPHLVEHGVIRQSSLALPRYDIVKAETDLQSLVERCGCSCVVTTH